MIRGFEQKRDYEFNLHVQSLRSLRMVAFYSGNFKKGTKPEKLFELPLDKVDRVKVKISKKDIERFNYKFRKAVPKEEIKTKAEVLGYNKI